MKNPKCRFIEEYANFKKQYVLRPLEMYESPTQEAYDKAKLAADAERIDKTVWEARRGYITVEECMIELVKIGNEHMLSF